METDVKPEILKLMGKQSFSHLNLYKSQMLWRRLCTANVVWKTWGSSLFRHLPRNIYLFKAINRNSRKRCEICSEWILKTSERRESRRSGVFIVSFEHISYLFLVFLLLILSRQTFTVIESRNIRARFLGSIAFG